MRTCKICKESSVNIGYVGICSYCINKINKAIEEENFEEMARYGRYTAIELYSRIKTNGTITHYTADTLNRFFEWVKNNNGDGLNEKQKYNFAYKTT